MSEFNEMEGVDHEPSMASTEASMDSSASSMISSHNIVSPNGSAMVDSSPRSSVSSLMGVRIGNQIFNSNDSSSASGSNPGKPRKVICNGRYLVLSTLGSGATGKVKLGYDLTKQETVALKLMAVRPASTRQAGQIQREIKAMTIIKNPYVLGLKHVDMNCQYPKSDGSKKACILLSIELAGGGELFDYMMYTGAFSEPVSKVYTRQLLEALYACHEQGVFHRDLKPENLLLDDEFTLKVADFGYSAIQNSEEHQNQQLHTECGTRSYMAPEVLGHQPYEGKSVDIWSSAIVIFIMLTGNPPMQLATRSDWWYNCLANGNTERFWKAHMRACPNLSIGARQFLNRMLKPNAGDRASIPDLLADPWLSNDSSAEMGGIPEDMDSLRREMEARKKKVDSAKDEEKEKAKLAAMQAKIAADQKGTFDPFSQQQQIRRGANVSESKTVIEKTPAQKVKESVVPGNANTKIYLPFEGASVESSLTAISDLIIASGGTADINAGKNKIKASSKVDGAEVQYLVKLEVEDGVQVANVSRRGGDIFGFKRVFEQLEKSVKESGGYSEGAGKEEIVGGKGPIEMM